jgi:uncharacterized protein YabN with tetrapyrrole methylase and pyrophosphatase domain
MQEKLKAFERLLTIMDELREKCPWDQKQTMESLRNLTIEETYELADAILDNDLPGTKEEIGDLMLHMVFYAKIASEQGAYDIADGDITVEDEAEVKRNWEQLKLKEGKKSLLAGVPKSLPAVVKAYRMQEKTAQVGFEWDNTMQVWEKVQEEIGELQYELQNGGSPEKIADEFGDVLFSLINYARFIGVDPETALERTNRKFKSRFEYIEAQAPRPLKDMTLEEMDLLWNQAKTVM